jgi:hypothetical protein
MSRADQFRQYADEAMRWAFQSKTKSEKEIRVDLCAHMDASGSVERADCWSDNARTAHVALSASLRERAISAANGQHRRASIFSEAAPGR